MPLIMTGKWPRAFGFDIAGRGPSYVTAVEKGGSADRAGLLAGDHILGVNQEDVRSTPADVVKTIARKSRHQPPTLSVVSHLHQVNMSPDPIKGFGFSVRDDHPIIIGKIEPGTPAAKSGLAEGDIILGVNGHPVQSLDGLGEVLDGRSRRVSLFFIPVGRNLQAIPSDLRSEVRVHRARQLYKKLNEVLGDDYEKKMAVVGVLKQYAENRNIVMLSSALLTILKSPAHRKLLKDFRLYIPLRHRAEFDRIVQDFDVKEQAYERNQSLATSPQPSRSNVRSPQPSHHHHTSPHPSRYQHTSPQSSHHQQHAPTGYVRRTCRLSKTREGYGFVLKGANPVHLESVDEGKSAAKAGLQAGDVIVTVNNTDVRSRSHQSVVQLLKSCEGEVTVDVLRRVDEDGTQTDTDLSSTSSGLSTSWIGSLQHTIDGEGRTFKQRMEYLLTPRERLELKGAVQEYRQSKDISKFCVAVDRVLDTPSKCSLWLFLRIQLPHSHQEYCLRHSQLATALKQDKLQDHGMTNGPLSTSRVQTNPLLTHLPGSPRSQPVMGTKSLKQQQHTTLNSYMNDLLSARERSQLKKALQHYDENRKVHLLLEDLEELLDTPDKEKLWIWILPLLEPDHQQVLSNKYFPDHRTAHSVYNQDVTFHARDDKFGEKEMFGGLSHDIYSRSPGDHGNTEDFQIIGEAAASIRTSSSERMSISSDVGGKQTSNSHRPNYQKHLQQNNSRATYHITVPFGKIYHDEQRPPESEKVLPPAPQGNHLDKVLMKELQKTRKAVAEAKAVILQASSERKQAGLSGELTLPGKGNDKRYITFVPVGYPGLENQPYRAVELNSPDLNRIRKFGPAMLEAQSDLKPGVKVKAERMRTSLHNGYYGRQDSESSDLSADANVETLNSTTHKIMATGKSSNLHSTGKNSVNGKAMKVLQQLDAAMENEIQETSAKGRLLEEIRQVKSSPKPPMAPNIPPPAPPVVSSSAATNSMSVKRINWEKLNIDNIQDTVWGQIGDTNHLDEVIQYLELEQQFSTSPVRSGPPPAEKEINLILSPKKAYNISILLGHLKLSASEMRQALYSMDESILTPELIKQLLVYAPSQQEMSSYTALSPDVSQLTLPDQFAYEMSQIPQYLHRLKAMWFKASFDEKLDGIKEALTCISKASKELRWSKNLAQILELILAMGNHLNKGNARVGDASAFRISYLSQLDVTKTQDNKHTFLHVLANASLTKIPDTLGVSKELKTVPKAAKVSLGNVVQDIEELKRTSEEITSVLESFNSHGEDGSDRFYGVMNGFMRTAKGRLESLIQLQKSATEDFKTMVHYFGEDPSTAKTTEIFTVFSEFITKFETAHQENLNSKFGGQH
ncbi:delphilin-like isoform X2 [Liolophura sinensis]|uniref:delphilin-like isoform X2 n=1 Tax=Liolophura sinensis TaxID=3198878 RepID=UPI003157FDAC